MNATKSGSEGKNVDQTLDNQLMEEVRDGRVEKLAVLFERHQVMLYNFFLRLTGNRNTSEDLVQEVFLRILKYRRTYQGQSKFAVWMYQVARNAHIDHLRKQKPEVQLDDQFTELAGIETLPVKMMEAETDAALLRRAMDQLPLNKREILILSRFQEMKYKDIAELLGCNIGVVKSTVHRAIKDLGRIYCQLQGGLTP